jgi:sulfur carrier protein ThiS
MDAPENYIGEKTMANNVIAQVQGGEKKILENVETVADVRAKMSATGYAASVNGEPADDSDEVSDQDFISFAVATKGGNK